MKTLEYDFEGTRTTIQLVRDDACKPGVQTLAIKV
jgi:hypothetical protein